MNRFTGERTFKWFTGVVVNINDPDKLGYCQIRVNGLHDTLDDEELPWAAPITPVTSASLDGVGISPTGIKVNSFVFGFFADGEDANIPLIIGTIPAIKENDINKHDVSLLARGENKIQKNPLGPEPVSKFQAVYPFNKVLETQSGHAIEIDDTPGAERIHVYHKSGTYIEIDKDGETVTKIASNNYLIVGSNDNLYVQGNVNINVKGNVTINVDGNLNAKIGGTCSIESGGNMTLKAPRIDLNP